MFPKNGVTILDRTMRPNEIRIIKSIKECYGFEIKNETGEHLFVEAEFSDNRITKLIIRK